MINIEDAFLPEGRKKIWEFIITPLNDKQRKQYDKHRLKYGFRKPNPKYDEYGLRFDIDYLNKIGGAICIMPLEYMAEYVDRICRDSMEDNDGEMEKDVMMAECSDEQFRNTNTTALGNIAYISLHTKNEEAKKKCLEFLEGYLNWYIDNLIKMMTEKFGGLPIQ